LSVRLGTIPIEVSLSANRLITDNLTICYEIVCLCRFTGFDHLGVSEGSTTRPTGSKTVIGKVTLAEDTIGHEQIVAQALRTARDNMKPFKQDHIFHA
jgi:hypothetical protein